MWEILQATRFLPQQNGKNEVGELPGQKRLNAMGRPCLDYVVNKRAKPKPKPNCKAPREMLTPRGYSIVRKCPLGNGVMAGCPQVKCLWVQEVWGSLLNNPGNGSLLVKHGRPQTGHCSSWVLGSGLMYLKFSS